MTVVVYAKEDLNSLENLITKYLSLIPDKQREKPLYSLPTFYPKNMRKLIKVTSNNEIDELNLVWVHDFFKDTNFAKPFNYIWYIFNFGGTNSLFSLLKKMGFAYDLNVKFSNYFENFCLFELKIKLTPLGFQRIQEITSIIFEYLEFTIKNGVLKSFFEEAQKLSILNFHYSQKKIDFPFMSSLSKKIAQIPNKFLLIEEHLWENFDESLIQKTLKNFRLDNLFIILNSKKIEKTDKCDPFFGTNYSCEQIEDDFLQKTLNLNFDLIPLNPFAPKSTKLVTIQDMELMKEYSKIPKKIYSSEQSEIFYKIDNKFKKPKCFLRIRVFILE